MTRAAPSTFVSRKSAELDTSYQIRLIHSQMPAVVMPANA